MAFPNSDCECVQGIEYFIDPRHYTPWEENGGIAHIELPWWERRQVEAVNKRIQEEAEEEAKKQDTETSASQRTVTMLIKGTTIINQGFIHLVAHQIKSFWISVETRDEDWLKCDISLNFKHVESGNTAIVPVLGTGEKFKIAVPAEVLVPGHVLISAIGTVKLGDYQVLSTEALKVRVYDPVITPVKWPTLKSYDVYFEYQRMMKSILDDIEFYSKETVTEIRPSTTGIEIYTGNMVIKEAMGEDVEPTCINLVHTEDGKLIDEHGEVILPFPIKIKMLGDSEV